tara:strand:+ start:3412 stop:3729 length:318 start_codon:yes stop_codon:yes gene_type:complete
MIYIENILDDNYELQIVTDGSQALYCTTPLDINNRPHCRTRVFASVDAMMGDLTRGEEVAWFSIDHDHIDLMEEECNEYDAYNWSFVYSLCADKIASFGAPIINH